MPRVVHRADSLELVEDLIVAGLGVGLLPQSRALADGVRLLPLADPRVDPAGLCRGPARPHRLAAAGAGAAAARLTRNGLPGRETGTGRCMSHTAGRRAGIPTDLTKPSWVYVLRKTAREFSDDQCTDLAAALTYYAVLALFPAMIALLSLVGLFGQGKQTVATLLGIAKQVGAGSMVSTIEGPLTEMAAQPQAAGFAFVIGLATALWSASGYVGSFGRAMNRMYEIREGRPFWKLRPLMLLVTLVALVLVAAVALALVRHRAGRDAVGNALGIGSTAVTVWNIAKWPVILLVVVLVVAVLYCATPNVKQPKFRWISVGALLAIVVWIVASALFGLYVADLLLLQQDLRCAGRRRGLPALALDHQPGAALRRRAGLRARARPQLQAGLPAEETLQLPPRDTRTIEKAEEKGARDVARGRELRESRGEPEKTREG